MHFLIFYFSNLVKNSKICEPNQIKVFLLRNLQVAYLIVDEMHSEHPELVKV